MKALLICPSDRENTDFFSRREPLVLVPLLGKSALDYALTDLARRGATEVKVLAADRPVMVRQALKGGKPWGIKVEVISEARELAPDEARVKYKADCEDWMESPYDAATLDGWVCGDDADIWRSPETWFNSLISRMDAIGAASVGMRQFKPGVWVGTKARISQTAKLVAPCWIGQQSWIAPGSIIGPNAVVETGACVDECASVVNGHVAAVSYVGSDVELCDSLASGSSLMNWRSGSQTEIRDAFLLADISMRHAHANSGMLGRAFALLSLLLSLPVFLYASIKTFLSGEQLLILKRSLPAPLVGSATTHRRVNHYELNGVSGLWRRLPELWNVFRGEFRWVGNRPLTVQQAEALVSEFERLWLSVPSGVFSLSDVEGPADAYGDTALAQSAFYATSRTRRDDASILVRALFRLLAPTEPEPMPMLKATEESHHDIVNPAT
jgi:Bacterial sugar transferase